MTPEPDSSGRGGDADTLAAVRSRHPDVQLVVSENEAGITLSLIRVSTQLQGHGKAEAALVDLLGYADRRGKPIALTPQPLMKGASRAALERWYRKHGFVPNRGPAKNWAFMETMIREPRQPQNERLSADPTARADVRQRSADDGLGL